MESKEIKHKKRYSLKKAFKRLKLRIKNLVDDFQNKIVKYICEKYKYIILPDFTLGKRYFGSWRSKDLKNKMLKKSKETSTHVFITSELLTTKICTNCGHKNRPEDRVYYCESCDSIFNRDFNAARNVMIKFISNTFKL
jgi:putative transposase